MRVEEGCPSAEPSILPGFMTYRTAVLCQGMDVAVNMMGQIQPPVPSKSQVD